MAELKKASFPEFIQPMLTVLIKKPFNDKEWLFENKWDGYRAIAKIKNGKVELISRNQLSFNSRFPKIVKSLKQLQVNSIILDGEIVVIDKSGKSNFQQMQNYQRTQKGKVIYYVFDILYFEGYDLKSLSLLQRKEILKKLLKIANLSHIKYSSHILNDGIKFFKKAKEKGLEGIVGKKIESNYQMKRSHDWVKIKTHMRQEAVIGGFTAPRGGRKKFGSLLIGVYQGDKLKYIGHVGGGFTEKLLADTYEKMKPLIQDNCPFEKKPKTNMPSTWVKPQLVCEVSFSEWTDEGLLRQPIFQGIRIDKKPNQVVREKFTSRG